MVTRNGLARAHFSGIWAKCTSYFILLLFTRYLCPEREPAFFFSSSSFFSCFIYSYKLKVSNASPLYTWDSTPQERCRVTSDRVDKDFCSPHERPVHREASSWGRNNDFNQKAISLRGQGTNASKNQLSPVRIPVPFTQRMRKGRAITVMLANHWLSLLLVAPP